MSATPGKLLKIPPWEAKYTQAYNRGELGVPTGQDDPFFEFDRALAFEEFEFPRLLRTTRGLPIVGNLPASLEVLGLRDGLQDDFANLERGARMQVTQSGLYTVWESSKYFGKPGTLLKIPKVVLIAAPTDALPTRTTSGVVNSLAQLIDSRYEEINDKGLLVILDESRNVCYNPYSYGVPLNPHQQPFTSSAFTGFIGGDLLTIHLNSHDTELFGRVFSSGGIFTGPFTSDSANGETRASYYYYRQRLEIDSVLDEELFYNEFTDPFADGQAWIDVAGNYNRRRHIIHSALFNFSPFPWIVRQNSFTDMSPTEYDYGVAPHGHGADYIVNTMPAGMEAGRAFVYNYDGVSPSNQDMADVIFEDIEDFFA